MVETASGKELKKWTTGGLSALLFSPNGKKLFGWSATGALVTVWDLDTGKEDRRVDPARVCVDHVEEHTVRLALDGGFWCGMTLYPTTKCTPARAVDILERYGTDRIMANSAGDWGKSDPLAVPELIQEMKRRGHPDAVIHKLVYDNPLTFFRQCSRCRWGD